VLQRRSSAAALEACSSRIQVQPMRDIVGSDYDQLQQCVSTDMWYLVVLNTSFTLDTV